MDTAIAGLGAWWLLLVLRLDVRHSVAFDFLDAAAHPPCIQTL